MGTDRKMWTAVPPAAAGYYWWRLYRFGPVALCVVSGSTASELRCRRVDDEKCASIEVRNTAGQWYGPVTVQEPYDQTAPADDADHYYVYRLDRDPLDFGARLEYADALDRRHDPRAEGYRAMGLWVVAPRQIRTGDHAGQWTFTADNSGRCAGHFVARDWFDAQPVDGSVEVLTDLGMSRPAPARRTVEDRLALGFTRLPVARRIELLDTGVR